MFELPRHNFWESGVGDYFCGVMVTDVNTILAIETSVPAASVALWREGELLYEHDFMSDRNHNSMVFDALEQALGCLGGGDIELVLVGTGPGSYSGTRIGIAAGQGVALAHGCPVVGVGSFAATSFARASDRSLAIGDARRGSYFVSEIDDNGLAAEAELVDHEAWCAMLNAEPDAELFTFDEPSGLGLDAGLCARVKKASPRASLLVDVWCGLSDAMQEKLSLIPLSPTYLRAPFTSLPKAGHPLLR